MTEQVGRSLTQTGAPSRTAAMAAAARGWHQMFAGPRPVLVDPLAWPLVGPEAEPTLAAIQAAFGAVSAQLSTWIAARSRFTEDWLASSGAREYVILGAGLDSFAWRSEPETAGVVEIDHPATQQWKRARLDALGVPEPPHLTWLGVDFETESAGAALARAGLGPEPFVSWLGVIPYLTPDAIDATLGALPACTLAISYSPPESHWPRSAAAVSRRFAEMARAGGEEILTRQTPDELAACVAAAGFEVLEDVGCDDVESRYGHPAVALGGERLALARKRA